ncbi:DNA/RNA non-specific endonuclease [Lentilactobacillus diolivorans]|uniref:DNA/RNA non-specific endonuclease n=1 Tax=Lentilactobacillus diolivorans TaxID=179838 RepID=UPI0024688153|nr:DNA/RNA non-specific endonuclease [Lentilactobacillus diolivorans]MDH5105867.1 DNA/RNA non-specific endonuclease [Lentilactobacillus diolivorans]
MIGGISYSAPIETPSAATYVYVTKTGKHYFYHRHNRGLNNAKKVYRVKLSTAKRRGLTLAKTDYRSANRRTVRKTTRKRANTVRRKTSRIHNQRYNVGKQVIIVNHNRPKFSKATLTRKHGAWQRYGQLDFLNRATTANALLNKRLMPTRQREPLYVDPTGWHNKKAHGTWLFNRCHLIGYQLTGQNNNLRNLITGTRSLNTPGMERYENTVAYYLRSSRKHYLRYQVKPVFKAHNLLASGVRMQGKSIGSNRIHFNVYIRNDQPGVKLNYRTGTSRVIN